MQFSSYPSKDWNFDLILATIRILVLLLYVLEMWTYPSKHWSSGLLFFQLWNSDLILPNTGFLVLLYTHRFSELLLLNCEILALVVYTLVFWCYHSKLWNSGRISISIGISILFFPTLQFLPYFCKHWNSDLILLKVGKLGLLSCTLAFWSYPSKHGNCGQIYKDWNSDLILQNIWILVLFL